MAITLEKDLSSSGLVVSAINSASLSSTRDFGRPTAGERLPRYAEENGSLTVFKWTGRERLGGRWGVTVGGMARKVMKSNSRRELNDDANPFNLMVLGSPREL